MANEKFARQTFVSKIAAGIVVSYVNTITHFSITLSGKFNLKEKLFRKEKKKSCAQRKREGLWYKSNLLYFKDRKVFKPDSEHV